MDVVIWILVLSFVLWFLGGLYSLIRVAREAWRDERGPHPWHSHRL